MYQSRRIVLYVVFLKMLDEAEEDAEAAKKSRNLGKSLIGTGGSRGTKVMGDRTYAVSIGMKKRGNIRDETVGRDTGRLKKGKANNLGSKHSGAKKEEETKTNSRRVGWHRGAAGVRGERGPVNMSTSHRVEAPAVRIGKDPTWVRILMRERKERSLKRYMGTLGRLGEPASK